MVVLVMGGAGYIGSHVCKLLANKGHSVIVYDNLSKGYRSFVTRGEFIPGDICDEVQLELVFSKYKIDAVMHFCAFIEVGESVKDPEKYYINNVANTLNILKIMRKYGVDKFIFSSTAAVYGMPERIPILEDDLKKPINPYGHSKYMIEQILEDYEKAYGIRAIRFRYFNAAGADPDCEIGEAHKPESHLIPLILDAALKRREDIKVFGSDYQTKDGTAVRDYVHVNDLADAHIAGLEYLGDGGQSNYFNLGSGEGFSVKEVIDTVKKVTGKDFKVTLTDRREGDPPYLIAKSDKVKSILGWKINYDLERIVDTAYKWHQKYINMDLY